MGSSSVPHLGIVIPVHYEQDNIAAVIAGLAAHVAVPYRVVVVQDRAEDPTGAVAVAAAAAHGLDASVVLNGANPGVRGAVAAGVAALPDADWVLVTMGDGCDDPATIAAMLNRAAAGDVAVVVGCRNMAGGGRVGAAGLKPWLSAAASRLLHAVGGLPTRDATNAFKLYARDFLAAALHEPGRGFAFSLELTVRAYAQGLGIADVPTVWRERHHGASNFGRVRVLVPYAYWFVRGLLTRPRR